MRNAVLLALLTSCGAGCTAKEANVRPPADKKRSSQSTDSDARDVIELAIKAHRGDVLWKLKAGQITHFTRGYVTQEIQDEITTVSTFQFPDLLRESDNHTVDSSTTHRVYVRNQMRAWHQEGIEGYRPTPELRRVEDLFPIQIVEELLTLLNHEYLLEYRGDRQFGKQSLKVVRLSRGAQILCDVSFDNSTKLVAIISKVDVNPKTGKPGNYETICSEYRLVSGLMLPSSMITYLDGEKFVEKTLREFKVMEHVDPAVFLPDGTRP